MDILKRETTKGWMDKVKEQEIKLKEVTINKLDNLKVPRYPTIVIPFRAAIVKSNEIYPITIFYISFFISLYLSFSLFLSFSL